MKTWSSISGWPMSIRRVEGILFLWLCWAPVMAQQTEEEPAERADELPSAALLEFLGEWDEEGEQWLDQAGFARAPGASDIEVRDDERQ